MEGGLGHYGARQVHHPIKMRQISNLVSLAACYTRNEDVAESLVICRQS